MNCKHRNLLFNSLCSLLFKSGVVFETKTHLPEITPHLLQRILDHDDIGAMEKEPGALIENGLQMLK